MRTPTLLAEGVAAHRIDCIGNILCDSFEMLRTRILAADMRAKLGLKKAFAVVTLHRPSNVDERERLEELVTAIEQLSSSLTVVFTLHPRTRKRLGEFGLLQRITTAVGIRATEPLSYIDFMSLVMHASITITDSGGVQEETTYLGFRAQRCVDNTERPVTVSEGTNRLLRVEQLAAAGSRGPVRKVAQGTQTDLWDGQAAHRAAASLPHAPMRSDVVVLPPLATVQAGAAEDDRASGPTSSDDPQRSPLSGATFEWRVARAVSALHGISPELASRLRWEGPPGWQRFLEGQRGHTEARAERLQRSLQLIGARATAERVGFIALKGMALCQLGIYAQSERPMSDLDLLVRPQDAPAMTRALAAAGFVPTDVSWKEQCVRGLRGARRRRALASTPTTPSRSICIRASANACPANLWISRR